MGVDFTPESAQRIGTTVIEWERANSRTDNPPPRRRKPAGPIPVYHAIANESIAADTAGEVEILDTDRQTRSGQTVQAWADVNVAQDDKFVIVWSAGKRSSSGGSVVAERWYIIAPEQFSEAPALSAIRVIVTQQAQRQAHTRSSGTKRSSSGVVLIRSMSLIGSSSHQVTR